MKQLSLLLLLSLLLWRCGVTVNTAAGTMYFKNNTEQVAYMLAGEFSSQQQAQSDPEYFDLLLFIYPIWQEKKGGKWFYVESCASTLIDRPYKQLVYQLRKDGGEFRITTYELPNPANYVNDWKKPNPLADLSPTQLKQREGCDLFLRKGDAGTFVGKTEVGECPTEQMGASYVLAEMTLHLDYIERWDRGMSADGRQVFGSTRGPYIYRRIEK